MEQRIAFLLRKSGSEGLTTAEEEELALFFSDEDNREIFNQAAASQAAEIEPAAAVNPANWSHCFSGY